MKNESLPGLENEAAIPELTEAAESYADARDDRMACGKVEKERKTKLIEMMKEHKLSTYRDGEVTVTIETEDKVKVKIKDDDGEGDED